MLFRPGDALVPFTALAPEALVLLCASLGVVLPLKVVLKGVVVLLFLAAVVLTAVAFRRRVVDVSPSSPRVSSPEVMFQSPKVVLLPNTQVSPAVVVAGGAVTGTSAGAVEGFRVFTAGHGLVTTSRLVEEPLPQGASDVAAGSVASAVPLPAPEEAVDEVVRGSQKVRLPVVRLLVTVLTCFSEVVVAFSVVVTPSVVARTTVVALDTSLRASSVVVSTSMVLLVSLRVAVRVAVVVLLVLLVLVVEIVLLVAVADRVEEVLLVSVNI